MELIRDMRESELLRKLHEGDRDVFSEVFLEYYAPMCVFARRFMRDEDGVEDVVQNVFLNLLQKKLLFKDLTHLKAYLFRSIHHACLNVLKITQHSQERESVFSLNYGTEDTNYYLAQIMRTEALMELKKAIAKLPKQAGKIIYMTYLEGKSNQEVADELNLSLQTVKNQKNRALSLLKGMISVDSYLLLLLFSSVCSSKSIFH